MNRSYESNGPDVKIRGTASHVHEKYQSLARDATVSGDRVAAENYLQHAEHYYRIIAAAQAQQQSQQPQADPDQPRDQAATTEGEPANGNGHRAPAGAVPPPDGGEQPEIAFPEESAPKPAQTRNPRGPKSSKPADIVAEVEANAETATAEKPKEPPAPKSNGESSDMTPPLEADNSDATPVTS